MELFATLLFIVTLCQISTADRLQEHRCATEDTELVLAFLVHRHGDRTPVEEEMVWAYKRDELQKWIDYYGYGELTNKGKRHGYELGKFMRRRYNHVLSPRYNSSEIYIRSTESTRAMMTVLCAMAAVYPAQDGTDWSDEINWTPVPYVTVPVKYDFNLAVANCPAYQAAEKKLASTPTPELEYIIDLLNELADGAVTYPSEPGLVYIMYDMYVNEISLEVYPEPKIMDLMPLFEVAASEAINITIGNEEYLHLQAGVLLHEFFRVSKIAMAGNDTERVRIYSAHDLNVYAFEAISEVTSRQAQPKYASAFALELRRHIETGQYVVLPVYLPSPDHREVYLPVKGCGKLLCDFDKFYEITSSRARDEETWRCECGFQEDMHIHRNSI